MSTGPHAASIAVSVALHAAAFGGLLQFEAVQKPLAQAVPLMVSLVAPPPPRPKTEPPKPKPVKREPLPVPQLQRPEPPSVLAVETATPGPAWTAPPPRAEPAPMVAAATSARVSASAPPARVAVPAPVPIVPPVFDAAYLQNPPPAYPAMSKRRGEQGRVVLRVFVSTNGAAESVEVRESCGHERLDRAAHDAVHNWRFVPARQGDTPVAAWVLVPITFSLSG